MADRSERFVYRVLGDRTLSFPTLGVTARPGETFEADHELAEDGNFVRVNEKTSSEKTPARPAEEA